MDNYKIIRFLNKGSYGKIYLVEKRTSKRQYALKSIKILNIDRYNKLSILNEIKILLTNNNDYLLKCYDLFIHENNLCIITDFIDNGDLENLIKDDKALSQEEITKIFLKICVGINSLHHNDIVHRDIKPANILITKDGNVKVCDFGICKYLGFSKITNTVIGTPFFMSPEQMSENYYDFKVDVWGIGCVLFELLYKKHPFNARNMWELKQNIRNKNPLSKIKCVSDIERLLYDFFQKNRHARPDLNTFLQNSVNKKLLEKYGINNDVKKYKTYYIKSVPYTERDWVKILDTIKEDFNLPNSPTASSDKKVLDLENKIEPTLKKCSGSPRLVSYAEIKKAQLKPIILRQVSRQKKPSRGRKSSKERKPSREHKPSRERKPISANNKVSEVVNVRRQRKRWDIENAKNIKPISWAEMYRQGKPLPNIESKVAKRWKKKYAPTKKEVKHSPILPALNHEYNVVNIKNDYKLPEPEKKEQLKPVKNYRKYQHYEWKYNKVEVYDKGNNWRNYAKHFYKGEEAKWIKGLRQY